jgi:hypothetical protein
MSHAKLLCPDCGNATVSIGRSIELPPDRWSDEISLQCIFCTSCPFQGIAVYRESRRGAPDSESWKHTGYRVAESVCASLQHSIELCPNPLNRSCHCPSHVSLGTQDSQGEWVWLLKNNIDTTRAFVIQLARP